MKNKTIYKISTTLFLVFFFFCEINAQQGQVSTLPKRDKAISAAYKHLNGIGVPLNYKQALYIFGKLAETGDAEAYNALGLMYKQGLGMDVDEEKSVAYFHKAAELGYAKGAFNLSLAYKFGHGTEQDYIKSFYWIEKAAEMGCKGTEYIIGYIYYKGQGVKQDYPTAVSYFQAGAEQGNASCMYFLGICNLRGKGMERNVEQGKYWLEESAKKGYMRAIDFITRTENIEQYGAKKIQLRSAQEEPVNAVIPEQYISLRNSVIEQTSIDGEWEGKIVMYDWSGKEIESEIKLKAVIHTDGQEIYGEWIQNDSSTTAINASMMDSVWIFNDMKIQTKRPATMKTGKFEVKTENGEEFLTGTITAYCEKTKEYKAPAFVALRKTNDATSIANSGVDADLFIVSPVPVKEYLNVTYSLPEAQSISLELFDIAGKILFSQNYEGISGLNSHTISTVALTQGQYLLKATGKSIRKSVKIIK